MKITITKERENILRKMQQYYYQNFVEDTINGSGFDHIVLNALEPKNIGMDDEIEKKEKELKEAKQKLKDSLNNLNAMGLGNFAKSLLERDNKFNEDIDKLIG